MSDPDGGERALPVLGPAAAVADDGAGPRVRTRSDRGRIMPRTGAAAAGAKDAQVHGGADGDGDGDGGGSFFGHEFAVVDAVEVSFRLQDESANLRAASDWLRAHPDWYLRTLWYEHYGAVEVHQYDRGPRGVLWLIAEHGSDDEADATVG